MSKSSRKRSRTVRQGQAISSPRHSAINDCPAEIWGRIFAEACTDDGSTGRSLSLVSKYIHDTSKFYKYQCLFVEARQLRPLVAMLKKLPPEFRCIRHLFLRSNNWTPCHEQWGMPKDTQFFNTDKNRLLIMISSTLQTLEVGSSYGTCYLTFQMPALRDLTLHGTLFEQIPSRPIVCYPQLQRFHLASYANFHNGDFLSVLSIIAPRTTELRVSLSSQMYWGFQAAKVELLRARLMSALGKLHAIQQRTTTTLQIQKIVLHPCSRTLANFFLNIRDDRFILLIDKFPHQPLSLNDRLEINKTLWKECRAGGRDYWNPSDDEIDTTTY